MNFYYDPILGLQYTYLGDLFLIDIDAIPVLDFTNFNIEDWIKYMKQAGIQLVDTTEPKYPIIEQVLNITEYKL
jgi:hypothetical protein